MSQDDSSKAEEERIQRAMNRKTRGSVVVKTGNELGPPHSTSSFGQNQSRQSFVTKAPSFDNKPKPVVPAESKPKPVAQVSSVEKATTTPISPTSPNRSIELDNLQMKKRTILGTIATGRRELEEVRNEIAKLKAKEAELASILEKRDQAVQQITKEIEELELKNQAELKNQNEEIKRREEERNRRVKEENEKRRREESEEERKRIDKIEEETEKKVLNPQQVFTPHSEEEGEDGLNAEELRLMRAMSRPGKGNVARIGSPQTSKPSLSKPAVSEADRLKIAEENKKKEEEQRLAQEKDLQQRIAHLQHAGGVSKTFVSPQIYDFDAEVKFIADFTNWEEIPITTPMDNNFTYSVSWKVTPGFHFFYFKINGKNEINKNLPTGLAPNGQLMNKVDCS